MNLTIHPTHTCFDDALDFLAETVKRDPSLAYYSTLRLVHGVLLKDNDEEYSHAWVEDGDHVWFSGLIEGQHGYCQVLKSEYYEEMRVQETTRYTVREAWNENFASGHFGPWVDRYRRLCNDYVEARGAGVDAGAVSRF